MNRITATATLAFALALSWGAGPSEAAPPQKTVRLPLGKPAPSFRLRALDGEMVKLDEIAYTGSEKRWAPKHPVVVDFFRTDCEPCKKSLPELLQLHDKYSSSGLQVILVALLEPENGEAKLNQYLAGVKLPTAPTFKVVKDSNNHFAKKYLGETVSLPATFLIDRDGALQKSKYDAKGSLGEFFEKDIDNVLREHSAAQSQK